MLVLWQLATNRKYFRPRLGSPITRVSCSPGDQYFAVCLQSNGECMGGGRVRASDSDGYGYLCCIGNALCGINEIIYSVSCFSSHLPVVVISGTL